MQHARDMIGYAVLCGSTEFDVQIEVDVSQCNIRATWYYKLLFLLAAITDQRKIRHLLRNRLQIVADAVLIAGRCRTPERSKDTPAGCKMADRKS